jgi:hypothetical protein
MNKNKKNNLRHEDMKYQDGYGVDRRKEISVNKSEKRRFDRALKTKDYSSLVNNDEDDYDDYNVYR